MLSIRHLLCAALAFLPLASPPTQVEDLSFDSNGIQIRFTVQGDPEQPPLIMLHGYAASLEVMQPLAARLAADHWVICVDARGHGKSGKPHGAERYGMEMVEDYVRLLDHLGIERTNVFGYSMGGMLTLKLVTTHPDRVVCAVAGGFGWPVPEPEGEGFDEIAQALENGEGFGPLFSDLTQDTPNPMSAEEIEAVEQMLLAVNDPLALAGAARGFRALALGEEELRENRVPTLSLVGARDPLAEDVERLRGVMTALEIVIIPDADHMTAGSNPEFVAHLTRFLAQHSVATPEPVAAGGR